MAEDNKPGSLTSSGAVVAAIAAMGFYYFHHEAPLVDLRPAAEQARIETSAAPQTVEARLWQDPFEALEKSSEKLTKRDLCRAASRAALI